MPRGHKDIQNCGRAFCKGAVRMVWAVGEWTLPVASDAIGKGPTSLMRNAQSLGLPTRPRQKPSKRVSKTRLLALWLDDDKTIAEIGKELGMSADAVHKRARRFGFPPRAMGPKVIHRPPKDFADMWAFGVGVVEIARVVGCAQYTVSRWARDAGFPLRYKRLRAKTMSQYIEHKLAREMRRTATFERAAWNAQYGKGSHAAA